MPTRTPGTNPAPRRRALAAPAAPALPGAGPSRRAVLAGAVTAAASAWLLTSCDAGHTARDAVAAAPSGSVTLALTAPPANLDFTTTSGAAIPQALMGNVYQGLVAVNDDGELVPALASAWSVDESGTRYTFGLQKGVLFSNGEEFTSATVKFSLERVNSDAWTNGLKAGMAVLERVETPDPLVAVAVLKRPSQAWLRSLATLIGAMFTPSAVTGLKGAAVGTGPFEVTSWKPGQSLALTRRSDYWGEPAASPQVTLRYYADNTTAVNALRGGAVDAVVGLASPELLTPFEKNADYRITQGTSTGEVVLSMNNQAAPFDDVRVRRAVMYGVDRAGVMATAYDGRGTLIGAPVPPTSPYYEDLNGAYPYDPARATALLKDAGVYGSTVTFSVPDLPYAVAASQAVASDLTKVGLKVKIKVQEFPAVWLHEVLTTHNYQMSVIGHVEPDDLLTLLSSGYYLGYDGARVASIAARADAGTTEEFVAGMREVVRTAIVEDAAADTLFLLPALSLMRASLQGLPVNAPTTALDLSRVVKA
ncbi:ABC transporter substrate-binding protein [Galactobacter valiniphilus]|uniref:ABC transporter substrate-binding protein n=1 Tax=Galactobacter valiniphilus TaxID=2676122 RepID=UPI00373569E5